MLKSVSAAVLTLLLASAVASAQQVPTDASIRELLVLNGTQSLLESQMADFERSFGASMNQSLGIQSPTPRQQEILDEVRAEVVKLFREFMRWETWEPRLVALYRKTFTQPEVDGAIAFLKTDAGRALVEKTPLILQQSMQDIQASMADFGPKLQKVRDSALERLKATR